MNARLPVFGLMQPMGKTSAARFVIGVLLLVSLLLCACMRQPGSLSVTIHQHQFELQLALASKDRGRGLGNVENIPENGGMLFVHAEPRALFYAMRHCLVDIDLLYLDSAGSIISMHEMKVEPPRTAAETEDEYRTRLKYYPSEQPAQFVIELRAGTIRELGLEVGEVIELPYAWLVSQAEL